MAAIYSPNNTLLLERKQSIKQNTEEIGQDAKILMSRNTFLSPETTMCMCAGRCVWGGLI